MLSNIIGSQADISSAQTDVFSASSQMLRIQMMLTKDFDEQLQYVIDNLKFINKIKERYRGNLNTLQSFMAQSTNTTREDGKKYYEASFSQMADVSDAFVKYDYNLSNEEITDVSMTINDTGENHDLDGKEGEVALVPNEGDKSKMQDWAAFFREGAAIKDPDAAREHANKLGDDDTTLPFYHGHTNNKDEEDNPKFAVFEESLNKMMEQIKNYMADLDTKAEELSTKVNQLSSQRTNAMQGLQQLIQKMAEIRNHTISKG